MLAKSVLIATALRDFLAAQAFLAGYTVERAYEPPTNLDEVLDGRVTVLPATRTMTLADRAPRYQYDYGVDVAIHKSQAGALTNDAIDAGIELAEQVADAIKGEEFDDCSVVGIEGEQLYAMRVIQGAAIFESILRVVVRDLR